MLPSSDESVYHCYYEEADILSVITAQRLGGCWVIKPDMVSRFGREEMVTTMQAAHGNYLQFEFRQSVGRSGWHQLVKDSANIRQVNQLLLALTLSGAWVLMCERLLQWKKTRSAYRRRPDMLMNDGETGTGGGTH
jgi:hypothetical protein